MHYFCFFLLGLPSTRRRWPCFSASIRFSMMGRMVSRAASA